MMKTKEKIIFKKWWFWLIVIFCFWLILIILRPLEDLHVGKDPFTELLCGAQTSLTKACGISSYVYCDSPCPEGCYPRERCPPHSFGLGDAVSTENGGCNLILYGKRSRFYNDFEKAVEGGYICVNRKNDYVCKCSTIHLT